jgi:hypothetical protein
VKAAITTLVHFLTTRYLVVGPVGLEPTTNRL